MLLRRAVSQCRWACGAAVASATVSAVLTGCRSDSGAACSGTGAEPRYADDAQAGGHVDGVRFVGKMLHKRLQDEGRGDREAAALAALSQSPRWQRFVPRYGGVSTMAEDSGSSEPWLVMENLAAGMTRPAVLDLKIGTRHYSPDAPPKKIAKEKKKAATSTIGTHGLRSESTADRMACSPHS